jgi:hypothetical protein
LSKAGAELSLDGSIQPAVSNLQHPVVTDVVIVIQIAKPQAEDKAPLQSFGSHPASIMRSACNSTDCLLWNAMTITLGAADVCCRCFSPLTPRSED